MIALQFCTTIFSVVAFLSTTLPLTQGHAGHDHDSLGPHAHSFELNGYHYADLQEFVSSGKRCHTREMNTEEEENVEKEMKKRLEAKGLKYGHLNKGSYGRREWSNGNVREPLRKTMDIMSSSRKLQSATFYNYPTTDAGNDYTTSGDSTVSGSGIILRGAQNSDSIAEGNLPITGYSQVEMEVQFQGRSLEAGERCDFEYSVDEGSTWELFLTAAGGSDNDGVLQTASVAITGSTLKFKVVLTATAKNDRCEVFSIKLTGATSSPQAAPTPTPPSPASTTFAPTEAPTASPTADNADTITVPTVIHVVTNNAGDGTPPVTQINEQMEVLNNAYALTPFRFVLNSILYVQNSAYAPITFSNDDNLKAATRVGGYDTLNIWVGPIDGGYLGWATFPGGALNTDGVIIAKESMPGGTFAPYDLGDTLPHEVGHWLLLYHTFQGGCNGQGDYVSDTPAVRAANYDCRNTDSCKRDPGKDMVENYMDYTPDACMFKFTEGQITRMENAWLAYRA